MDTKIRSVTERDVDIYLKTHAVLGRSTTLTKQDIKQAFEIQFEQAKEKILFEQANRGMAYDYTRANLAQTQRVIEETFHVPSGETARPLE